MRRAPVRTLLTVNTYWVGLSFLWTSLHVLILPAVLLGFVPDQRKNTVLGLLTFAGLVIAMIIQPLSGAISDRWRSRFGRRRPLIALGTLVDALFLGGMAFAGGLPGLALAYVLLQVSSNTAHGPVQGLMHDLVPTHQMGLASGIKNLFDMGGMVIASLLMGRTFSPEQPRPAFAIILALLWASALVTLAGSREEDTRAAAQGARFSIRESLRMDWSAHGDYWRLIVGRLLFLVGVYGIQTFAQYYVRDTFPTEDPLKLTGDLLAAIVLALMAFSMIAGYLCDRFGRKRMHFVAAALMALGSVMLIFARSPATVLAYGGLAGAGIGAFISANWALANHLAPRGQAGKFLGLTNLATAGAAALSRLGGPGIDALNNLRPGANLGYAALFGGAALLAVVSLWAIRGLSEAPIRTRASLQA